MISRGSKRWIDVAYDAEEMNGKKRETEMEIVKEMESKAGYPYYTMLLVRFRSFLHASYTGTYLYPILSYSDSQMKKKKGEKEKEKAKKRGSYLHCS